MTIHMGTWEVDSRLSSVVQTGQVREITFN